VAITLARNIYDPNQEEIAKDIFNNTFLDVFGNYDKENYFDSDRCNDIEKGIKAWLAGIARTHYLHKLNTVEITSRMSYLDVFPERPFFDQDDSEAEEEFDSPLMSVLQRALKTLSDRDREILLIAIQFEEEGRLPKEVRQSICRNYGLAPDSLRQVKKRSKAKIEKYLEEHGYLTKQKSKPNV
jgi:DNA-directed RNA polymerase specialized sigma24 family protein